MIEALAGGTLGAIVRLAPELLNLLDRKNERKHEIALGQQSLEVTKLQLDGKLKATEVEAQSGQLVAALQALQAGITGQATKTGNVWVDGLSSSVRPIVTYGFAASYLYVKMQSGSWEAQDTAIFSGILNFWFLGRVFEKR